MQNDTGSSEGVSRCRFRYLSCNDIPANTLFDFGDDYSFISQKFGKRLELSIDKLDNALVVKVASGNSYLLGMIGLV